MKYKLLILLFVFIFGHFFISYLKAEIIINENIFNTDVVVFQWDKLKGLGGKEELKDDEGMFFLYLNKDIRSFWMKDMQFPIDILWVNGNKIVNISENVPIYTNEEITRMNSVYPIDKVIELKAGTVSKYGIKINDEVKYKTLP
ncbi:MAG: DUF192 domain-containing protein [Candidatus Pacebacteria bacterium]|nr:DUF192 domain-containing protein [Candidatus Paceibacterota bacterium]